MRKIFLLCLVLFIVKSGLAQEKPFIINGTFSGKSDVFVYLSYPDLSGYGLVKDSTLIKEGSFTFNGKLNGITEARVMLKSSQLYKEPLKLVLEPGIMSLIINDKDFANSILRGSEAQNDLYILKQSKAEEVKYYKSLEQKAKDAVGAFGAALYEKKDEGTLNRLREPLQSTVNALRPAQQRLFQLDSIYLNNNPSTYAAATILYNNMGRFAAEDLKLRFERLSPAVKKTQLAKRIDEKISGTKLAIAGNMARNFTATELRGTEVSLSDYRGKYVLLDFWASWCVPCRAGNPHLISLYNKYKDKGLEIIGIAGDDRNPDVWRKAVEEDNIGIWKHVLSGYSAFGLDKSEDINSAYGITLLPTKILIDPSGKIIGRYGGGRENDEAMDKKLAEIFNN